MTEGGVTSHVGHAEERKKRGANLNCTIHLGRNLITISELARVSSDNNMSIKSYQTSALLF